MKAVATIMLIFAVMLPTGCVYTHVSMPYSTEFNKTELGQKQGQASMYSLFWLFAWGDAGAAKAAKNGDINVLTHMDRDIQAVLFGIYTRMTTIVYGD